MSAESSPWQGVEEGAKTLKEVKKCVTDKKTRTDYSRARGVGQKCNRHHGNELKLGIGLRMSRTHLKMTSPPSVHVRIAPKVREGPGGLGVNKSSVGVNDVTFGRCRAHNVYFLPPQIRFQVTDLESGFKSQTWKPASDATFKAPIPPSSY